MYFTLLKPIQVQLNEQAFQSLERNVYSQKRGPISPPFSNQLYHYKLRFFNSLTAKSAARAVKAM